MLIVVRRAVAVDRRTWPGPDLARPLSPLGERQAEGLVLRLDDYPVERILAGPALRCRQTVAPLARQRLVQVEPFAALGLEAAAADLLDVIWATEIHDAVLCTHGTRIGEVLGILVADGVLQTDSPEWPLGSAWLLQRLGRRQVVGRYLPPLAYDPALWPAESHDPGGRVWGPDRHSTHLTLLGTLTPPS